MTHYRKALIRIKNNLNQFIHKRPCILFGEIVVSYHCPQRCLQCTIPQKASQSRDLSLEEFKIIVDRLEDYGTQGLILSGGDPISHPDHLEMLEYVASKNFIHTHVLSTLYGKSARVEPFIRALLDYKISLTCSFDGLDGVADRLRGAPNVAQTVWKHMEYLENENRKRGYPIKSGVNIVISQMNLTQITQIITRVEKLGWTVNLDLYRPQHNTAIDPLEIKDLDLLQQTLNQAKELKAVITPHWILNGYLPFLSGKFPKLCPYLSSPYLGGKYFIQPDGQIQVCRGKKIGNILEQDLAQIFSSPRWREMLLDFESCSGCWNTCYTPPAKISNYFTLPEIKNVIRTVGHRKRA